MTPKSTQVNDTTTTTGDVHQLPRPPPSQPQKRHAYSRWLQEHEDVLTLVAEHVRGVEFDAGATPFDPEVLTRGLMRLAYFTSDNALLSCKDIYEGAQREAMNHMRTLLLFSKNEKRKQHGG